VKSAAIITKSTNKGERAIRSESTNSAERAGMKERTSCDERAMKAERTTPQYRITQFLHLVREGQEAWEKAGALLVKLIEEDENIFEKIIAQSEDGLRLEHLLTFERIGRGQLYPRLLLDESYAAKRVLDLGLPFATQVELHDHPIQVAVVQNGCVVTNLKRLNELNRAEAQVVLGENGARTVKEQASILMERKGREVVRYRIDGDSVIFFAHSKFTRAQLEDILKQFAPVTATAIKKAIVSNRFTSGVFHSA
jgi:hypothetical protein